MKYELKRVYCSRKGSLYSEIIFDFWNNEYETGYEIKLTLYKFGALFDLAFNYVRSLCGETYDISKWDLILRNVKQRKVSTWECTYTAKIFQKGESQNENNKRPV